MVSLHHGRQNDSHLPYNIMPVTLTVSSLSCTVKLLYCVGCDTWLLNILVISLVRWNPDIAYWYQAFQE